MSASTTNPVAWHEASSYATAVRRHLDDLPPDVVEELAGGLEADLLDQATESTEPLAGRLGDPAGYATELRAAAGLPPRTSPHREKVTTSFRRNVDENLAALRVQPWWPTAVSVAVQLQPVWWVVRAWVAFQLVTAPVGTNSAVPTSFGAWVLLLVLVAGSVALGRGLWSSWSGRRIALRVANGFAVLMLLPALGLATPGPEPGYGNAYAQAENPYAATGLVAEGKTVTNVFPYGPDGEPLQGVTLLDQDGDPLAVGTDTLPGDQGIDASGRVRVQVPNWTEDGDMVWNVFPMGTAKVDADEFYSEWYSAADRPGSMLRPPYRSFLDPDLPRLRVPAVLVDPSRSLSSVPSPVPSQTATEGSTPVPSQTAPATPTAPVPTPTTPTPTPTTPAPTTPAPTVTP